MLNIGLLLIPSLIRSYLLQATNGIPIQHIHYYQDCINPINIPQLLSLQYIPYYFNNNPIFPFIYSILLWSIGNNELPFNVTFFARCKKHIGEKISTTFSSQIIYASSNLIFNMIFKIIETTKCFILVFKKKYPTHSWIICCTSNDTEKGVNQCVLKSFGISL